MHLLYEDKMTVKVYRGQIFFCKNLFYKIGYTYNWRELANIVNIGGFSVKIILPSLIPLSWEEYKREMFERCWVIHTSSLNTYTHQENITTTILR